MISLGGNVISPAPFLQISRTGREEMGGRTFASATTLTLRGTLISWKGSPFSDGSWWTSSGEPADESIDPDARHASILAKQKALRSLFSTQNQILIAQPWDGSAPTKWVVRLKELTFPEGVWYDTAPWQATFDADEQGISNPGVESLNETWQVEVLNEDLGTYRVTHNVSAKGKTERDAGGGIAKLAWEQARDYVLSTVQLGLDSSKMTASGVLGAFSLDAYNYLRSQSIDEIEGTVNLSENWVAFDDGGVAPATHEQTISKRVDQDRTATVTIEGTIQGLRGTDNSTFETTSTKVANRDARWSAVEPTLFSAASGWFGAALSPSVLSETLQCNQTAGSLSYSRSFSNRPSQWGGITERISIRDDINPGEVFAALPVPARAGGPIFQDMDTVAPRRRVLTIEIQMPAATLSSTPAMPNTNAYVLSQVPSATWVFLESDPVEWSTDGRYSRTTSWAYGN